jgi:hypothetical protein
MTIREFVIRYDDENVHLTSFDRAWIELVCDNFNTLAQHNLVKLNVVVHDENPAEEIVPGVIISTSRTRYEFTAEIKDPNIDPESWTIRIADPD